MPSNRSSVTASRGDPRSPRPFIAARNTEFGTCAAPDTSNGDPSAAVIARLHAVGQVIESSYRGAKARFKVRIPPQHHAEFAPFIAKDLQTG